MTTATFAPAVAGHDAAPVLRRSSTEFRGPCHDCEEQADREASLARRPTAGSSPVGAVAPESVHRVLGSTGEPLPSSTQSIFADRLGHDFSRVRIHHDAQAATSAADVQADAFTVGHHVVFGAGRYRPATDEGRSLLAHELVHVVQQRSVRIGGPIPVGDEHSPAERVAEHTARGHGDLRGAGSDDSRTPPPPARTLRRPVLQRQPSPGCRRLLRRPGLSNPVIGRAVHAAIAADFQARVGPRARFQFPDASAAPWRTEARQSRITPQQIGGRLAGIGRPDLAYRSRTGAAMLLAEIKPANWAGYAFAETQLLNYITKGNSPDNEPLRRRLRVRVFSPMLPQTYRPPSRLPLLGTTYIVLWCGPGIIVYKQAPARRRRRPKRRRPTRRAPQVSRITRAAGRAGAYNFGLGLSIGSTAAGAGNVGLGISINSQGVSVGTVSAGIVIDSQGAALGSVGAGTVSGTQSAGAATAGAGTVRDSSLAGVGTAGAGSVRDATQAAAGVAGTGSVEGASGTVAGSAGTSARPGGGGQAGGPTVQRTAEQEGEPGASGASAATTSGAPGTSAVGGTSGPAAGRDAATGGAPQPGTVPVDPQLSRIVTELTRDLPGADHGQVRDVVVSAARLDALVQRATPAQQRLLRMLAVRSSDGVYALPAPAWLEMILGATVTLTEDELAALLNLEWRPGRTTEAELREAIQASLARLRASRTSPAIPPPDAAPAPAPAPPPPSPAPPSPATGPARPVPSAPTTGTRPTPRQSGPTTGGRTASSGAGSSGTRLSAVTGASPAHVDRVLRTVAWLTIGRGTWRVLTNQRPAVFVARTVNGTRIGALVTVTTVTLGRERLTKVGESSVIVTLDPTRPGDSIWTVNAAGEQNMLFLHGMDGQQAGVQVGDQGFLPGLVISSEPVP